MQHILEHLVLAGSSKYPVRDPFFTALKGSFSTYLNASTSHEFTAYEFATINGQELVNLARIYLDAVFHPLLTEAAFRREGWRLERVAEESTSEEQYIFSGVVYNEMKGALSSPSAVLYPAVTAALFPDTHLAKYSGGDPIEIPTLSHEELLAYHREHYHPSRARIYLHGDMDNQTLERFFSLIDETVNGLPVGTTIPRLPLHTSMPGHRVVERLFPIAPESPEGPPLASIGWPLGKF
jgi:Zn-dependent M16 (insulinase) family peptidase